jgi:hypothetical protein
MVNPATSPSYSVLVLSGGNLYFNENGVRSCGTGAQCLSDSAPTLAPSSAVTFAVDANGIYFIPVGIGSVQKCPLSGCGAATPTTLGTAGAGGQLAVSLAVDGAHVFFATGTTLFSVPDDGSAAATPLVNGLTGVYAITVDDANVYYSLQTGEVSYCAKSGCAKPTMLTTLTQFATALVSDGVSVYMLPHGSASIIRCAIGGCDAGPLTLAAESKPILGFTVDDSSVYWASGGVVKKVVK